MNTHDISNNQDDNFLLLRNQRVEGNRKLTDKSKARMRHSRASNTLKAYHADWKDFTDWCGWKSVRSLPAEPETITNYINDLADDAKANTVARRVTAISENHIAAGFIGDRNPAKASMVRDALSAIRREKGTFQQGKAPILLETLYQIALCFGDDIQSLRDRAVIMLGFAGAFRRSELARIQYDELTFTKQGMIVFVPRAKGDQLGKGSEIAIPYAPDNAVCAVSATKNWLDASGITAGPIFRPFISNMELRNTQLSDKSIALIVKKYAELAGFDPKYFAGHSLRRGFATSAAQHDVDTLTIMKQTRHKSEKMVHRYIEQGNLFRNNALTKMYHD